MAAGTLNNYQRVIRRTRGADLMGVLPIGTVSQYCDIGVAVLVVYCSGGLCTTAAPRMSASDTSVLPTLPPPAGICIIEMTTFFFVSLL